MSKLMTILVVMSIWVVPVPSAVAATWYVDDNTCPGSGTGSQADPFCSIQDAITAASDTDEILVSPGTYGPVIDFVGKAITLRSTDGPAVTTIDGNGAFSGVVICVSGEGPATVFEGFTVTGGSGLFGSGMRITASSPTIIDCTFTGNSTLNNGGGIRIADSSVATITNCRFTGNSAANGGGIFNDNSSSPTITGCTFSNNTAPFGGGMANFGGSSPTVSNCSFTGNTADTDGGGVYNENGSDATLTGCVFNANQAANFGGAISSDGSNPTVVNCVFSGNSAAAWGGGMYLVASNATVTNCTFSANAAGAGGYGGGGMLTVISNPVITNCVFWSNTDNAGANTDESAQIHVFSGTPETNYSVVQGLTGSLGGTGNLGLDPGFVDELGPDSVPGTGDEDLRPSASSPCIDAADSTAVALLVSVDLDGNPRGVDDPATTDTGVPVFELTVDIGPYELQASACTGDFDGDGDTDLADYAIFASLFTGPLP